MFTHILVPTDGSSLSDEAVKHAITLAGTLKARLTVLNAISEPPFPVTNFGEDGHYDPEITRRYELHAEAQGKKIVEAAVRRARETGIEAEYVLEVDDSPHRTIVRLANDRSCDLIVMASHGRRGINALLIGSETQKVLTSCKVSVLVWR